MIEKFEAEGCHPGDVSIADLPGVLKLKKELCEANVWYLEFFAYVLWLCCSSSNSCLHDIVAVIEWISYSWYTSWKIGNGYKRIPSSLCCHWGNPWTGAISNHFVVMFLTFKTLFWHSLVLNLLGGYQSNIRQRGPSKKFLLLWCCGWERDNRGHFSFKPKKWKLSSLSEGSFWNRGLTWGISRKFCVGN